jgi:beta-glucosidase
MEKKHFNRRSSSATFVIVAALGLVACSAEKPTESPKATAINKKVSTSAEATFSQPKMIGPVSPVRVEKGKRAAVQKAHCGDAEYKDVYMPGYVPDPLVQQKVDAMMSTLSEKEKADQMRGMPSGPQENRNWQDIFRAPDNTEKDIRGFQFRDGPRGLSLDAGCKAGQGCFSTVFPVEIARGATFDADLERRIGEAVGDETLASGNTIIAAPCINIVRHPAWGRTQETYGEDSFLLGRMGSAYISGAQETIPACVKHFAANNVELNRRTSNASMDEQTLREIYGTGFEMTVRDGGAACVMESYNKINGINAAENRHLLTEILRDDFGFKGFVLSDWWALANDFDVNLDEEKYESAAKKSIEAGVDVEMPWSQNYKYLETIVEKKKISPSLIDAAARRILEQKVRFNIENLKGDAGLKKSSTRLDANTGSIEGNEAHMALAFEAAIKSHVLLKNENNTLPIDVKKVKTIAVLGAKVPYAQAKWASKPGGTIDFAKDITLGDLGSSRANADPLKSMGPYDGIKRAAGENIRVIVSDSAAAAKQADFVVVVAGLTPGDEGEEYTGAGDRKSFGLDAKIKNGRQDALIREAALLGKPMVVVLVGGSVIDMPWIKDVPAVVMSWYSGMQGGRALGELLFGRANFSGKLPLTWPNSWSELLEFDPGVPNDVKMDYYLGYRYYDKEQKTPLFPFGAGLSYTSFAYDNLEVPCDKVSKSGVVNVKVDVINQGTSAGEEIVFLFVSYPKTASRRSVKELKGFARLSLNSGEAKQITIPLPVRSLKFWNMKKNAWEVESGPVTIQIGGSSAALPLSETVIVD